MTADNVVFTPLDTQILGSYKDALAGLSEYLGPGYEIVLHSLEDFEHSVVAIFNGERTGRHVGSPVTDLALQMLSRLEEDGTQDSITYFNRNSAGEPLKSTTVLIRGQGRRVIGLLCINLYLNTPLLTMMNGWGIPDQLPGIVPIETLAEEAADLIDALLEEARAQVCADGRIAPTNRNKEIIAHLYERGVFNLKNSVNRTAELLHLSKNTVYLHIRNLEKRA